MKLTEHFTLEEMCKTSARTGDGNIPSRQQIENLKRVCRWLELLRSHYNAQYEAPSRRRLPPLSRERGLGGEAPIIINSAFRSPAVNRAVGGSPTSNHLTGCAADIRVSGIEQALRYAVILLDISDESGEDFDELLIERNKRGAIWLHFAVRASGNRRKVRLMG